MTRTPELHVEPSTVMIDEPMHVSVSGLAAEEDVTLRAAIGGWSSEATFRGADDGTVDVARDAPTVGSYDEVSAMGLFWSMAYTGDVPPRPTATPEGHIITVTAEDHGAIVSTLDVIRMARAPGVEASEVRDDSLVGVLYLPPGAGPHPALLV